MKQVEYYKNGNRTLRIKYEGIKKLLEKKDKEIERLNNIINELEEWLEQEYEVVKANSIQEPNNSEWYIKWNERKNTLDKLQELKGDGSNE